MCSLGHLETKTIATESDVFGRRRIRDGRDEPSGQVARIRRLLRLLMEARPTKRQRAPLVNQRPFEGWRQLREAVTIEMRPRRFHWGAL
jgi:hypothetical protein